MNSNLLIREVKVSDSKRLVEIYDYYVKNTAVSFEYKVPSVEEFEERIRHIREKYPYIVCLKDDKIVGYAYASAYSSREAYNWTATSSIYVDKEYHRQGAGSLLYKELEERLRKQGIVNLLAGVAYIEMEDKYLTKDSYYFHTKMGYEKVAHMKAIGKKFDRWYDLLWLQKKL
ncbi:MAG: GNAT family N-acetyltransferase [Treponema sp.]|nr:GNAT family N-acetyltransferase [Treponema sp.]